MEAVPEVVVPEAVPAVRGAIDSPEPGATFLRDGEMALGGWALRGRERAASVRVVVNDEVCADAETGIERPDVPVGLGDEGAATDCGWRVVVDLQALPPGEARVKLLVRGADDGLDGWACATYNVYPLRGHGIRGNVDAPKHNASIVRRAARGHRMGAHASDHRRGRGGVRRGRARPGASGGEQARRGERGGRHRAAVRLRVPWRRRPRDDGPRTVSVTATDLDGSRAVLGTVSVTFRPHAPTTEERRYGERLSRLNQDSVALAPRSRRHDPRSVLVFTHSVSLGGGQLYLQDLIREIRPKLNRCVLMTPVGGVLGPELESMGVDVVISGRGWDHDIASYEGHIRQLQHLILASGCGVVLLNTLGQFAAADAAQRVGVPTIWALHESMEVVDWIDRNSVGAPVSAYVHSRIEAALRGATRLVFEADATRRLYQRYTAAPERAVTQNYAVDVAAIDAHSARGTRDALRAAFDLPADAVVLLCVGVFEERKSQGSIMEAFRHVAEAHPTAMLVLVGDHPCPLSEALHHAVPDHLASRIRFVPITQDIWDWYRVAGRPGLGVRRRVVAEVDARGDAVRVPGALGGRLRHP